jgi:hypothetical protein
LNPEFPSLDLVVDPLMTRIEAPRVAGHGDQTGLLLHIDDALRVGQGIGHRYLDLHVLPGAHDLHRLIRMYLGRAGDDCRFDAGLREAFRKIRRPVGYAAFLGYGFR